MDERADDMNDMDDMDFVKLFSSLDSVKASDDLKTATLDAIFASAGNDPTPEKDASKSKVVKFPRKGAHSKNNPHRLRIAGIAACFALLGTVGTAFNMPTSYASVDYDGTNLTIGINSLGVAVSADSDSDKGKKLIADNELTNVNYRDSIGTIATSIATHSDGTESTIELSVNSDNESQRESVKKGSSEAIEISGYSKKASKGSAPATTNAENAVEPAESKSSETTASDESTDDSSDSFVINTNDAQDEQKGSAADDAVDPNTKYHPLSDDTKNSEDKASSETGTATDTETETSAEENAPEESAQTSESAE